MINYLNDAMGIDFTKAEEYTICSDEHLNCKTRPTKCGRATICGKCYQDPDKVSKQLYDDISKNFEFNDQPLQVGKKNLILTFDDKKEHEMSTDYIGPSRAWGCKYLKGDLADVSAKIGDFLLVSRTIGGHVFWPAHQIENKNTINQVRGGRGIYDRFDITLAELKHFFETQIENKKVDAEPLFYGPLYEAFGRYKWFFEEYEKFDNYVNKMKLNMFLHEGNVFSLVDSNVEQEEYKDIDINNYEPRNYEQYINNCKNLIKERTDMILRIKCVQNRSYRYIL